MKSIGVLLYECKTEEIKSLPQGFPIIEYDGLYESIRIIRVGEDRVRHEKRYVYLLYKLPPEGVRAQ